jgi:hypothetical protein
MHFPLSLPYYTHRQFHYYYYFYGFTALSWTLAAFFLNSGLWGYWLCGHSWPIVPASGDDSEDDCGEIGGKKIGRQRKPKFSEKTYSSTTFVYHKIPHDQTRVWTRATAVGSRRLTAWAMARPYLGSFISSLILYTVGKTPWTGDQPFARPLPAHRTTKIQNKRTQTSMPRVGFEPTIPAFERTQTVHALDHAATVICRRAHTAWINCRYMNTTDYLFIKTMFTVCSLCIIV